MDAASSGLGGFAYGGGRDSTLYAQPPSKRHAAAQLVGNIFGNPEIVGMTVSRSGTLFANDFE